MEEFSDIGALKPGKTVNIRGEIKSMEPAREIVTKFGYHIQLASAILVDETGEIKLTIWEKDIERVAIGDKIEIFGGWVSEYKGQLQITTGKKGRIEVNGEGQHEIEESILKKINKTYKPFGAI